MLDDRILLITGKGGVGRSVFTAAIATCLAARGQSVLLCDLGAADGGFSPLARLMGQEMFASTPAAVAPNIKACHLTPAEGHRAFLAATIPGGRLLSVALKSPSLKTLLETAPSFAEMGIFYQLLSLITATTAKGLPLYEHIIVDLPATGHTLALTGLPAILEKIIPHGPVARGLESGQAYLNSAEYCHAWVVTLPEQLPVSEALELLAGLEKNRVPIGGLIVNRRPLSQLNKEQLQTLKQLGGGQVAGASEVERRLRAIAAEERLLKTTAYELLTIPELRVSGPALVQELAHLLRGALT